MAISEFEKQRQANIERNKRLLSQLNLSTLSNDIYNEIKKEEDGESKTKKRKSTTAKPKKSKPTKALLPTRRSRRLAGVELDDDSKVKQFEQEQEQQKREREELEKLKTIRVNGDLSLLDLVKTEEKEDDSKLLMKFQSFLNNSKNFSIGDYYDTIVKKDNPSKDVQLLRSEFADKALYPHFKPNDIKLTRERMTYIAFVPLIEKKLIIGGDTNGNCGLWNSDNTEEVDITSFKLHGKSICKYEFNINEPNKVYSASYDGSIRCMDLKTLQTTQFFINDFDIGISDINFNNDYEIYYTTLQGEFGRLDLRSNDHSKRQILRLSNKKIGGFAINPLNKYQIATGSLDRTLKIWDIRKTVNCDWNEWDDELSTLHAYGAYNSRLSVSTVDWNRSNDLVCNGYDDTINIFSPKDLVDCNPTYTFSNNEIEPIHKIKHNCQTGRWVSIIKAKWHKLPSDRSDKFVIANMNKYFDIYSRDGMQVGHISDPLMTNVPAVCNFHQTENWVVGGGASGKVYLFF